MTTPVALLTKLLPNTFNAGIKAMQEAANAGDEKAKAKFAALKSEPFAARIDLEGEDETLYLAVENGVMSCSSDVPKTPVTLAVALPHEAIEVALDELGDDKLKKGLGKLESSFARFSVARTKPIFDKLVAEKIRCHFVVKDTPDFDEVRTKIAIGESTAPQKPAFTVTVDYETFDKITRGQVKPQAILGTLQITGDSARVMQLAMEIMQGR